LLYNYFVSGKIARSFDYETFPVGTTIIKEGDKGKKFYIIKEGTVKVTAAGVDVSQLVAGQYFGEMALLDDEVRKVSHHSTHSVTSLHCFHFSLTFVLIEFELSPKVNLLLNTSGKCNCDERM